MSLRSLLRLTELKIRGSIESRGINMEISITPDLEEYVREKVASGTFKSASELFNAAVRLLENEEQKRLEELADFSEELSQRLASLDRGEHVDPLSARERIRFKSDQRTAIHV